MSGGVITWKVIKRGAALVYAIELRDAKAIQGRFKPGSRAAKQLYHAPGLLHSGERLFNWVEALDSSAVRGSRFSASTSPLRALPVRTPWSKAFSCLSVLRTIVMKT